MNRLELEIKQIDKRFGPTHALERVSLTLHGGEIHALIGENGAGKSTLMKIVSGALAADEGEMVLNGLPFRPSSPIEARRAGISMIYQELSIVPALSVEDNLLLGIEPGNGFLVSRRQVRECARRALAELGLGSLPPHIRAAHLSMAARQMVEIARSVVLGSRIFVFDEPTSRLSADDGAELFGLIRRLRQKGCIIVYISHFLEEVLEIADCFTVLRDGKMVGQGIAAQTTIPELVGLMTGEPMEDSPPRSQGQAREAVVEVIGLSAPPSIKSAGFVLYGGEILGIAGLVGAGRTELLRAIFGLDQVRTGSIRIGLWTGPFSPAASWQRGVGMVSEDRKGEGLFLSLSVAENMLLTYPGRLGVWSLAHSARNAALAQKWIDRLPIRCQGPKQEVAQLSGGNQQKIALARLLAHEVDVLLLDEPTRGIDVASKTQIYRILEQTVRSANRSGRSQKAAIVVSSYFPELLSICDRIAVMSRGVLGPARPASSLNEKVILTESFTGSEIAVEGIE